MEAVWIFPYAIKLTLWGTYAAHYEVLRTSVWKKGTFPFHITSYIYQPGRKGTREKKMKCNLSKWVCKTEGLRFDIKQFKAYLWCHFKQEFIYLLQWCHLVDQLMTSSAGWFYSGTWRFYFSLSFPCGCFFCSHWLSIFTKFQLLQYVESLEKVGGYVYREICVLFLKIHYNYSAFKWCILQGDTPSRKRKRKSTPNEFWTCLCSHKCSFCWSHRQETTFFHLCLLWYWLCLFHQTQTHR